MLYNIYTSDICKEIPKEVKQVQFADDIAIFCTERNLATRKNLIESAIEDIHDALAERGLDMQPKKTKIINFNREGNINRNTKINCVGTNVQLSQEQNF